MDLTLYGIASCDTCRKARRLLDELGVDYEWHDMRLDGLPEKRLRGWIKRVGWEAVLNRRSATWRRVPDVDKDIGDEHDAVAVMLEYPTLVKRPVLEAGSQVMVGLDEEAYRTVAEDAGA